MTISQPRESNGRSIVKADQPRHQHDVTGDRLQGLPDLSKSRAEETPRRFTFDRRTIEVAEVLDAWLAPDHRYFKVRGDDGACYILRNDVPTGRWELAMFDRTGAIG
jgi:hypothetical protein